MVFCLSSTRVVLENWGNLKTRRGQNNLCGDMKQKDVLSDIKYSSI